MSGHAAYALVLLEDRGQFATQKLYPSGEHLPPSRGESPFPLDCYLSWMSPVFAFAGSQFLEYCFVLYRLAGIPAPTSDARPEAKSSLVLFSRNTKRKSWIEPTLAVAPSRPRCAAKLGVLIWCQSQINATAAGLSPRSLSLRCRHRRHLGSKPEGTYGKSLELTDSQGANSLETDAETVSDSKGNLP
jgi:hypothetical protein